MAPYVYPHVHCKTTFIAPLILIGLSILLVCDTTEIMMNRSLILVIDVAWNSCRRIGRKKARQTFGPKRIDQLQVPNIFPKMALSACSSRGRLRTPPPVLSIFRRHERNQRTISMCIRCF